MPETNVTEQATREIASISVNTTTGAIISALAIYGGASLTMDVRRKFTQIRANRKARKVVESEQDA